MNDTHMIKRMLSGIKLFLYRGINRKKIEIVDDIREMKERIISEVRNPSTLILAILNYLKEIEDSLLNENLVFYKLDAFSFGIFRLVTDDYQLEQSSIGQDLLGISTKIQELKKLLW
jgi:hypothetical protein